MKIMIFDQGHPVTKQLASKAVQVFDKNAEIVIAKISEEHPWNALDMLQKAVDEEQPQVLLIGATTLGEEIAPALGIRLGTGVAAHCIDMFLRHDGELTFMIPEKLPGGLEGQPPGSFRISPYTIPCNIAPGGNPPGPPEPAARYHPMWGPCCAAPKRSH